MEPDTPEETGPVSPRGAGGAGALRGFSWMTALHAARMVVRLALFPLVLRYFGPEQKGLIDIALATYFVGIALYLNIDRFQLARIPALRALGHEWSVRTVLWQGYGLHAISQVTVSLSLAALAEPIASFYGIPALRGLITAHALANLIQLAQSPMHRGALLAFQRFRQAATIDFLMVGGEALATVAVITLGLSATQYVFLIGLAPLSGAWYGWIQYRRLVGSKPLPTKTQAEPTHGRWWRDLVRFSLSVSAGIAIGVVYERMGVLAIAFFYDPATVAFYNLAFAVLAISWSFVALPETVFIQALSRAAAHSRAHRDTILRYACQGMFGLSAAAGAGLATFAPEIVQVLGGPDFVKAVPLVAAFSLFPILNAPDTVRLLYLVENRPNAILARWATIVVLEFASYFAFQPYLGLWAFVIMHIAWRSLYSLWITWGVQNDFAPERSATWLWRIWLAPAMAVVTLASTYVLGSEVVYPWLGPGLASLVVRALLGALALLLLLWVAGLLDPAFQRRIREALRAPATA